MRITETYGSFIIIDTETDQLARINGLIFYDELRQLISAFYKYHNSVMWEKSIIPDSYFLDQDRDHLGKFNTISEFTERFSEYLI